MENRAYSPKLRSRARRHFLGLTAAAAARVAGLGALGGVLGSAGLSSSAEADNGNHFGWSRGAGNPHGGGANCFLEGTAVLTPTGERLLEDLEVGDLLETASGKRLPIRWIGRQTFQKRGADWPRSTLPIRVARGALGECVPHKDLYLSPDHALLLDGVLIPAKELVNGATIVPALPDDRRVIRYFQVLLDRHEAILAEGAAAETFLPRKGNQRSFENYEEYKGLYCDQAWPILEPFAPTLASTGQQHLKALFHLGIAHFLTINAAETCEQADAAYERVYERLTRRVEARVG